MLIGKRVLSLVLALVLLVGMHPPVRVHAEDTEAAAAEETVPAATANSEPAVTEATAAAVETSAPAAVETSAPTEAAVEETTGPTEAPVAVASDGTTVASGTCGENLTWVLDAEGTLTISGTGPMTEYKNYDYIFEDAPWYDYKDSIVSVVIEDGVTSLNEIAFMNCWNIQKVTVPASVTKISYFDAQGGAGQDYAPYYGCSLESAGPIGSGCDYEFGWTETIPAGAFFCAGVKKVIIPETITSVGWDAFNGSSMTSAGPIGSGCAYEFGWTTKIADGAFNHMYYLTSVTIPETVTSIGEYAFYNCTQLEQIDIPESVISIGDGAFQSCSKLQGITLPEKLKSIGDWAFSSCSAITELELPSGLESLGKGALSSCQFTSIVIPEKITELNGTFSSCSVLESITLPSSLTSIGNSTFYGCNALKEITLPETVTTIGSQAFSYCKALTTIAIPDGVTTIEGWTFRDCSTLVNIVIPAGVTSIGDYAFYNCPILTDAYFKGSYGDWLKVTVGEKNDPLLAATVHYAAPTGGSCGEAATWELTQEGVLTISGTGAVTETPWKEYASKITIKEVMVKDGITALPSQAFAYLWYCEDIEKVTIAGSVTTAPNLFDSDIRIQKAGPIGSGCEFEYGWTTEIPDEAFMGMENLLTFQFPEAGAEGGIKRIGDRAFFGCKSLSWIVLPETLEELGSQVFYKCTSLEEVTIPASVQELGIYTFEDCTALTDLVILCPVEWFGYPTYDGTESRYHGYGMLRGCSGLKTISLPRSVCTVYENLFYDCVALKDVYYGGSQEEWDALMSYLNPGNENLKYATVHPGWNAVYLGDVRFYHAWENVTSLAFFDYNDSAGCLMTEETDQTFRDNPELLEQTYVMVETRWEGDQEILLSVKAVETRTGYVSDSGPYSVTIDGVSYAMPIDVVDPWRYIGHFVIFHLYEGNLVGIREVDLQEFLDNSAIEINGPGSAYAYYQTQPYRRYYYQVNGTEGSALSDANGLLTIPLDTFTTQGSHDVTIQFTKIDSVELTQPLEKTVVVSVNPISFEQEWTFSLDGNASASLDAGLKFKLLNIINCEAKVIGVESTYGIGSSMKIKRDYSGGSNALEIVKYNRGTVGVETGAGIEGGILGADVTIVELAAGVDAAEGTSFGLKIDDYSQDNYAQQKAIAAFLLNHLTSVNENNVWLKSINNNFNIENYLPDGCTIIEGENIDFGGSIKANMGGITVNDIDLFTAAGASGEIALSFESSTDTDGSIEKTSSYKTQTKLSALSAGGGNGIDLGSFLVRNLMGLDTEITSVSSSLGEYIEATALSEMAEGDGFLVEREYYIADYNKFVVKDEVLSALTEAHPAFRSYLTGSRKVLSAKNVQTLADALDASTVDIPYSKQEKKQKVDSLSVGGEIGVVAGVGAGVEAAVSEFVVYDTEIGVYRDGEILITGESDESLAQEVENREWHLDQLMQNAFAVATADIRLLVSVVDALEADLEAERARLEAETLEGRDWSYYLMYHNDAVPTGDPLPYTSYAVSAVSAGAEETAVDEGIKLELSVSEYSDKVMTIGSPMILMIIDNATEEEVTDFSDTPMSFTIRYSAEELEAAGLSVHSSVVADGGISIYRYSDSGDYYEYVGGTNDLEAMTVTATITKTGQYILAADSCAPSLRVLDMSDFRQTPTIKAIVDDPGGLDVSKFAFTLDGVTKADSSNIGDHYDPQTATFTFAVPEEEALAEGAHTMSFTLADTAGNTETYTYTFHIDLTAPVINSVAVTGATNKSSAVEIRAAISDENLTFVYALLAKRLPDGTWTDEVSTKMTDLGDGIWGVNYVGDGSTVTVRVCASDIGENQTYSEQVEVKPYLESVTLSQEYVALYQGQTHVLEADVSPAEFASQVIWSVDDEDILAVDQDGTVTAKSAGTAYVIATVTDDETVLTARCRVDVTETVQLDGIQLSTTALTTELYSTNYSGFEILLQLPQNYQAASTYSLRSRNTGVAMESARFTNPEVAKLFELVVLDDRSVLVIPTDYAVQNPKLVASKCTDTVTVTVQGKEYVSEKLTLTVKKSTPKLKATVAAFNSFYSGQSQQINVSGGTVTSIYENEAKNTAKTTAIPYWMTLSNGTLTLKEDAPLKSVSGKAYILVETEEWRIPTVLTLSVKNTYKARGLKLSASSVTMTTLTEYSDGVSMKLLCTNKKETLNDLNVTGITAPDGYAIENFNAADGSFTLKAEDGFKAGKIILNVTYGDTDVTQALTLTVKTAKVTLKLSAATLNLNTAVNDSAVIQVTATPADYRLIAPTIRLTGTETVNGKKTTVDKLDSGELDIRFENGQLKVMTTDKTPEKASYKLYISAGDSKEVALAINVITGIPSVTYKATGSLDLSFPENHVTVKPTFKYYNGGFSIGEMTVQTAKKEDATAHFQAVREDKTVLLSCAGETPTDTYTVRLQLLLDNGSKVENTVKVTVKRTAVKLKLSASKLSLNKLIGDEGSVTVTCTTKGYAFDGPIWSLTDSKNQSANNELTIGYDNGKLTVATNDTTQYGKTYKIVLKANDYGTASTLTISIPAEAKSKPTVTIKAGGKLDIMRDSSAVTITPTYKNCITTTMAEEELFIYSAADKKYTTPVNELFSITPNGKGGYEIRKAEGAVLPTGTYKVKMVTYFGETRVESSPISLSVVMGSVKLTMQTQGTTLFAKDKNDRALVWFETTDATLNGVVKVEIKDAKYRNMFEVIDYGDGLFAIGYKDGVVDSSLIGKTATKTVTLTLNVYLEGNETTKANTTAKVKLTIVK